MQKYTLGFTLIELLIGIFILSVALMGYLRVDLKSQQILQKTATQQLLQRYHQQFYELLQTTQPKSDCPACVALHDNQTTLLRWQTNLAKTFPELSIHYTITNKYRIKLILCKVAKSCHDFIIQV